MSSIKAQLTEIVANAFKDAGFDPAYGSVVESQRPDLCQFQCNGALAAAKAAKKNPREVGRAVMDVLKDNPLFGSLTMAGPGFINITVADSFLANHVNAIAGDGRLGCPMVDKKETVVVDFGSPNVAKPMHVGHLRSAIIGDSLRKLFAFFGYTVIADNHIGDWGTQMGMLIRELRRRQPALPYFDPDYKGPYPENPPLSINDLEAMYPVASKRAKEDEAFNAEAIRATDELQKGREGYRALWNHFVNLSLPTLKEDFFRLNIVFDHWYGESFYADRMPPMVERLAAEGHAVASEGALVLPVARAGDTKEIPPLILVKTNGGFLYGTSDMATIEFRRERFDASIILYVVDARQSQHFEQVFRAVRKTGIAGPGIVLEHVGFGTVNGPDGKPFKTRAGGVMKLSDLIEDVTQKAKDRMKEADIAQDVSKEEYESIAKKVGVAALKFADLMNHRMSNYTFDMDKFSQFEGKTGPYLLYSAVRIKSILRKASEKQLRPGAMLPPGEKERNLMLFASALPDALALAKENYAPNSICDFAYQLSQEFNRFYKECHILREENETLQASWLGLAMLCLKELELLLGILGIEVPERM